MNIWHDKVNLEPASLKNRSRSGLSDLFIFIVLTLFVIGIDQFGPIHRIIILGSYILIFIPLCIAFLGGSPGHLINNLRVRRYDDYEKNIPLGAVYIRMALIIASQFIGIFNLNKQRKILFDKISNAAVVEIKGDLPDEYIAAIKKRSSRYGFAVASVIYIAWVIWLQNYWFLFGLIVIYDIYISKKINWSFWKRRDGKNSTVVEWIDALIFAVIAVTLINIFLFQNYKIPTGSMEKSLLIGDHLYVSKVAFGPRIPNTPIAFPFSQHTLPLTKKTKSYVEWIKLPYKRLKGFGHIKRDDVVVFNFPAGDTVVIQNQATSYYSIVRDSANFLQQIDKYYGRPLKTEEEYNAIARDHIKKRFDIVVRPVDRRDNYIKRCVAISGDTLEVKDAQVYVNGKQEKYIPGIQHYYTVIVKENSLLTERVLERLGITEYRRFPGTPHILANLTQENVEKLRNFANVLEVKRDSRIGDSYDYNIFPSDTNYRWTLDNFGPLYIPKKGATIEINMHNLPLYERVIGYYEHNSLEVKDGKIYVNGDETHNYTFKMNYYWMMGDNRHSSLDSRFWGFVPEDHIVGKPKFVWLSLDKNKSFPRNIRLSRMFMSIK